MPANKSLVLGQLIRFGAVGVSNTILDLGVFFLSVGLGMPYLPAQVLAYLTGTANSFLLNRYWTFQIKTRTQAEEIYRFTVINGLSLLVSTGIIFIVHGLSGFDLRIAKVIATAGGIVINFVGSRWWVFKSSLVPGEHEKAEVLDAVE